MTTSDVTYGHSPRPVARFVLKVQSRVLHDLDHLSEACNTDQIIEKRYFASPGLAKVWLEKQGRKPVRDCHWCLGG